MRLKRGRNESTRVLEALLLVKYYCCALNCRTSTQKTKSVEKYPEMANVRLFSPPLQGNRYKNYAAGMQKRERRMRSIAASSCHLDSLNVSTRHTRICPIYFEGGLDPTKLNNVSSTLAFPQHLPRRPPKSLADPEERRWRKQ